MFFLTNNKIYQIHSQLRAKCVQINVSANSKQIDLHKSTLHKSFQTIPNSDLIGDGKRTFSIEYAKCNMMDGPCFA